MATINGFTSVRMLAIELGSIVSGFVNVAGNLILTTKGGTQIDAGNIKGDKGDAADIADVVGLVGALDGKAPIVHNHIALVPTGGIVEYGGDVAPSGWLMADGSAVSRTVQAALFSVYGTKYGTGDGSTTFNLPNRQGRIGIGKDSLQTEFNTIGKTGGSKTHNHGLASAGMNSHTHTQSAHTHVVGSHSHTSAGHTHPLSDAGQANLAWAASGLAYIRRNTAGVTFTSNVVTTTNPPSLTASTAPTGNGITLEGRTETTTPGVTSTNNAYWTDGQTGSAITGGPSTNALTGTTDAPNAPLPPYLILNYIIKT